MITLYKFGATLGLPDPSPFVVKVETLLRMAGLDYQTDVKGFGKAPKGKLPYIDDDGAKVADSTFIRRHLEQKHGIDFDKGLGPSDKAVAWSFEKMCEEHLYWAIVHNRWMIDRNFTAGPARYFERAPAVVRPFIVRMVRGKVRKNLLAQGLGRHTEAELNTLAIRDVEAISAFLGEKPWLMGAEPCGADASVNAFVTSVLCPVFEWEVRTAAEKLPNLVAYGRRGMARWFPEIGSAT